MTLPQMAIKRAVTFTMLYIMVLGFGLFSFSRLKLALYPDITFPMIAIITRYQGAGPFDMETTVTRPIEQAVVAVENVKTVTSRSSSGLSYVGLEFDWGTDMEAAQTHVQRALEWVGDVLPPDVTNPLVFAFDIRQMPILFMGVGSSTLDQAELRKLCIEQVSPRLERVEGVAAADIQGGLERQIRVEIDPRALASYGLPYDMVVNSLRAGNLQLPGGVMHDRRTAFSVRTLGEYQSLDEIRGTVLADRNGQVIHLDDVADVADAFKEREGETRIDAKPGLLITVRKQSDANVVQVVERVRKALPDIVKSVPGQLTITPIFDQAEFINMSISNLTSSAYAAFALTVLVLLIFLRNIRSSTVVAVAIPTSVVAAFFAMDMAGITLNVISMAGLALAIGMLVDNAIVVLENVFRHHELGEGPVEASENGTQEVGMAITASTLTTLAIFIPVLFVPGIAGVMFNDMVVTITIALSASLIVALTLVPLMASRMMKKEQRPPRTRPIRWLYDIFGGWLIWLDRHYTRWLRWSLAHRKTVILTAAAAFGASIMLIRVVGVEFMPKNDEGQVNVTIERAVGADLPATMKTMRLVEQYVQSNIPELVNVEVTAGSAGNIGSVFQGLNTNSGSVQIKLKPITQRSRSQFEIEDQLRKFLDTIPGITYAFQESHGMGSGADVAIKLFGNDLDRTGAIADRVVDAVKKIPGAVDVRSSLDRGAPELQIVLDRARLQEVGLTAGQVTNAVSNAVQGAIATRYREAGDEYDVFVRLAERYRQSPEQLDALMISAPSGVQVPLRQIADIRRESAPVSISREDQSRVVEVTLNTAGRDLGSVVSDINKALVKLDIPRDIIVAVGGTAEDQRESFNYLGLAILAGVALVYIVMASQFESFVDPLIILVTIPLAFIGVALALFITNTPLDIMGLIGMLVLVGVVVNNGIVMVDFINQLRRLHGMDLYPATIEGARARVRPVLMTALTTVFGMLPLALGLGESGETWAPLARAVMGGLTVATALTLVVVPVTYTLWESLAQRVRRLRQRLGTRPGSAPSDGELAPTEYPVAVK